MKKSLLSLLFLMVVLLAQGQRSDGFRGADGSREIVHLHLNKTTFLQGERLWFKAYVLDQVTKGPSFETTNLYVGIYGEDGKEVKRKLFYVENGMAQGDFGIDSTLTSSAYTVLGWTNYMRNFKELEPYRQRILILRDGEADTGEVRMQLSAYPEGGQLIAGAYNNVGILVDNGLGQGVKVDDLELVDGSGNVIRSNITTNDFGMGKTGFTVGANERYHLQRRLPDGSYVREMLPNAVEGQLGLTIDNNGRDKVLLTLLASKATFDEMDGEVHTVALYQDDYIRLEDMEVDADEPVLSIDRKELPYGVVTTVLFDTELRPMAHRMFFNHGEGKRTLQDIELSHCLTEFGDSLQVDLILPKGIEGEMDVSLSALPGNSVAYRPDHSIASSFLIRPYIKRYYQDHYFFQGQDRRKRYELDKRLLIEGWGRYDWDSRRQQELQMAHAMETGIPFEGRIIDADLNEERQISLIAELSGEFGIEELENDKTFKGNLKLFEGDSLGISLLSKKGKPQKPRAELSFLDMDSSGLGYYTSSRIETLRRQYDSIYGIEIDEPINIGERTIALDEVTVTERVVRDNKFQISALVEGRLIDDADITKSPSVSIYLRRLGFIVGGNNGALEFLVPFPPGGFARAPVRINGMLASPGEIMGMPLSSVKFLAFSKDRNGPFISISLNPDYVPPNQRNKFIKFAIENGYTRPQEYFTPNYPDYSSQVFKSYGALDWRASVSIGAETPTTITIPIKNQKSMELHFEGMGDTGFFFVEKKTIDLSSAIAN